jgi:flagellar protein FliO/FliZ
MNWLVRVRGRVTLVCLLAITLDPVTVWSAEAAASPSVNSSSFGSLLQVMFGLGVVLAAIAATAWLLKRLGPGQVSATGALRVVAGVAVGPKERVVLVDVGETRLVLGVAPGHVSTLHQMPRPVDEKISVQPDPMVGLFQDKLKALLSKRGRTSDAE